ncbi:MAG: SIS domain-containing protein, partial [Candidatus Micrarchaeota archaeon]
MKEPILSKYMQELEKALKAIPEDKVLELSELIYQTSQKGNTVYLFGNGDSANNALHYALDLGKGTINSNSKHKRLRLISLTENIGLITAWGNDESYESIFKQQLENLAKPGDLVCVRNTARISEV